MLHSVLLSQAITPLTFAMLMGERLTNGTFATMLTPQWSSRSSRSSQPSTCYCCTPTGMHDMYNTNNSLEACCQYCGLFKLSLVPPILFLCAGPTSSSTWRE